MKVGKVILFIFGLIGLLTSMGIFFGGGAIILADQTIKDSEGYYSTRTVQIDRDSYAVVTPSADIFLDAPWDWADFVSFKVTGSTNDASGRIFIGVAPAVELDAYLNGVEYDEINQFSMYPSRLDYIHHSGSVVPGAPTTQTFWAASAFGSGTQTLEWSIESGRHALLLMNADGAEGIDLDVELGIKMTWLIGVGIGLVIMGIFGIIISIVLIWLAFRSSSRRNISPGAAARAETDSSASAVSKQVVVTEQGGKTGMGLEPNVAGLLCYIFGWVSGIIFFILEKDNKYVRFHALQSIIVFGFLSVAGAILGAWPFFGGIFEAGIGIITLVFWIILMIKAYHGEKYKMPWVGDFAEKQVG